MASVGNITCVKLENVGRSGINYEAPYLYVKGTWLPSEFTVSVCDGHLAWTGIASKVFVLRSASELGVTESEYIDSAQMYLSKQQPDIIYELMWAKNSSPELICRKGPRHEVVLKLPVITAGGQAVPVDMLQFMLDAHMGITDELARKTRAHEREIASKELSLTSLKMQNLQLEEEMRQLKGQSNGKLKVGADDSGRNVEGMSSRGKRKGGGSDAETGSRKRTPQAAGILEALPILAYRKPSSPEVVPSRDSIPLEEQSPSVRPPLSLLGYKQPKVVEERDVSNDPSWLDKGKATHTKVESSKGRRKDNGLNDDSQSDEYHAVGTNKAFVSLGDLSDVALAARYTANVGLKESGKRGSGKKQAKASGPKSGGKQQPLPSLEASSDQVEDVVEKGIKCVDNIGSPHVMKLGTGIEVSSPLTTPIKQQRKSPPIAKKSLKTSPKEKKSTPRSSSKKKPKKIEVETSPEASEELDNSDLPESSPLPVPGDDADDRAIVVQSAEFHDFDESRTEDCFTVGDFWALYDDQDGMPRFYGRIVEITRTPFNVSVEWLEPHKPSSPANGLVKTAKLSAACGEFTFGTVCHQDLPAFSHIVDVEEDKKGIIRLFPAQGETWALYRHWDKKHSKAADDEDEFNYKYDLVNVLKNVSAGEDVDVVPLVKVFGFKSLFTVEDVALTYCIPYKQVQARFSHCIPKHQMCGSESPGVPVGAWELDPASTPAEYLGAIAPEGSVDKS